MKYRVKEVEEVITLWDVEATSPEEAEEIVNEGRGGILISKESDGDMRSVEVVN